MDNLYEDFSYLLDNFIDKEKVNSIVKIENINDEDHYYIICKNKKNKMIIKHFVFNDEHKLDYDKFDKKCYKGDLFLSGGEKRLKTLLLFVNDYNPNECGIPRASKRKGTKFYIGFLSNNNIYGFDKKNNNDDYLYFYELANYLLIYSGFEEKDLFKNIYLGDTVSDAVNLDIEISIFMKKHETGRNYSFEKKINELWGSTGYQERCKELVDKMNNFELVKTLVCTDYVSQVGNIIDHLRPEYINEKYVKNDSKYRKNTLYKFLSIFDFIYDLDLTEEEKKEIISRIKIVEYIDEILNNMSNEEIYEEVKHTKDYNFKLDLMKYIKKEKEYKMYKHINDKTSELSDTYIMFRNNPSEETYKYLIDILCLSRILVPLGKDKGLLYIEEGDNLYLPIFDSVDKLPKEDISIGYIEEEFSYIVNMICDTKMDIDGIVLNYNGPSDTVEFPIDLIFDIKSNIDKGIYSVNDEITINNYEKISDDIDDNLIALSHSLDKLPKDIEKEMNNDLIKYLDDHYQKMEFESKSRIGEFDYSNGNYIVLYGNKIVSIINNVILCNDQEILRKYVSDIYKLMK